MAPSTVSVHSFCLFIVWTLQYFAPCSTLLRFFSYTSFYQNPLSDFLSLLLSFLQWLFSPHHGKMFMSPPSPHLFMSNIVNVHGFYQYLYASNFGSFRVTFPTASDLFPPSSYTAVNPHIQTNFSQGLSPTYSFHNVYLSDWEQLQSFKTKKSQESFLSLFFNFHLQWPHESSWICCSCSPLSIVTMAVLRHLVVTWKTKITSCLQSLSP